jgi:hypothetical protein
MGVLRSLLWQLIGVGGSKTLTRPPQEAEPPALRVTLKLIGYWAAPPCWTRVTFLDEGEPPWPDIRRAVRVGWESEARERLVGYLRDGHRCNGALGFSACRFECRANYIILGSGELTDGEWIWPEGLPHYVERHGVTLPEAFVAAAAARGWRVPPVDRVGELVPGVLIYNYPRRGDQETLEKLWDRMRAVPCRVDASVWLEWARDLPGIPTAQIPPNPGMLERFCLVAVYPDTDVFHEPFEGFDDLWEEIGEGYGRHAPDVGGERVIEYISVDHRETVVGLVLEGLRRYGLMDRIKLICSVPDPNDWHRNRDVIVWPRTAITNEEIEPRPSSGAPDA